MTITMSRITSIDKWLKENRAWPRANNITFARRELSKATTDKDKAFWQLILERLGDG